MAKRKKAARRSKVTTARKAVTADKAKRAAPRRKSTPKRERGKGGRFVKKGSAKRSKFFQQTSKVRQSIRDLARKRKNTKSKGVKTRYANKIKDLLKSLKKSAARAGVQNVKVKGESTDKSSQKGVKTTKTSRTKKPKGSAKAKQKKTNRRTRKSPKRK